jgi:Domain of Unknown Function (DUF1206)
VAHETTAAERGARRLRESAWFRVGARAGFAAAGLLHILVGGLAISVVAGGPGEADQSGALAAIGQHPAGVLVLWAVVVGLFAVGLWQILEAATVRERDRRKRRLARLQEAGVAVAYVAVGVTAFRYANGSGSSTEEGAEGATAGLLGTPLGAALLLTVAAASAVIGIGFLVSGVNGKFLDTIERPDGAMGRVLTTLGRVGYLAKGVAVVVIGVLFAAAVFTDDASWAGGLDGALKALASLPFGIAILLVVALGFISYGLFLLARAWRARL